MARQGKREFVPDDTLAVIANSNQFLSARDDVDLDSLGSRIETVFNEFLDHGSRALDDLTGRDLVNQVIWELLDGHSRIMQECDTLRTGLAFLTACEDRDAQRLTDSNLVIGEFVGMANSAGTDVVARCNLGNRVTTTDNVPDLARRFAA